MHFELTPKIRIFWQYPKYYIPWKLYGMHYLKQSVQINFLFIISSFLLSTCSSNVILYCSSV